ncbi:AMP-dependent synthetase [Sulfodiicoccus acidiphilus]|uniref:AMP-dependent synthetase n=1 Tax=Sulfodiicoccus acidiphilus TaxID=1670455 RepID=A0A348B1W1_9CREN|nr:AMP-binding protein [Sulfodiicoccus acidiphilus]BBD72163.1 AMP-dependent synthetase [Sulfodiicoccus acidiphilus]GGT94555.1 AMP-dependent synthetase [Sulfodiicoccus acidiphilus]
MVDIIREKRVLLRPNLEDYDSVCKDFSWVKVREELGMMGMGNGAGLALRRPVSRGLGEYVALRWISESGERKDYPFSTLLQQGLGVANALRELGLSMGDRVVLLSKRVPSLYFAMIGVPLAGGTLVPVFTSFGREAIRYRIENSGAKMIVVHESLKEKVPDVEGLKVVVTSDQSFPNSTKGNGSYSIPTNRPFVIVYTSGSTGKPKGIWHSHDMMTFYYVSGKYHFDLHEGQDVFWHTGDPAWIAGFAGVWTAWVNGVTLLSYEGRFDPERWATIVEENKVTVLSTAPTAMRMLKKAEQTVVRHDLSSLRFIHAGGEYVDPDLVRWSHKKLGLPVHDAYGQTETATYVIANFISLPIKVGSMGRPLPGVKALVVDEKGRPLPANTPGLLAFVPDFPALAKGVWNDDERWKAYFKGGYYVTGDRALVDEDGYFWYLGREDDVIKVSGYRVSPVEIESVLMTHPAVAEAAVIGVPDPERGNRIKAYVVLREDYSSEADLPVKLREYVKLNLASHMAPAEVEIVKELPHTLSGKILRRLLRSIETKSPVGDTSTLDNQDLVKDLKKA